MNDAVAVGIVECNGQFVNDALGFRQWNTAPQIEQAFRKAGWLEPKTRNGVSILDTARAVANNEGFGKRSSVYDPPADPIRAARRRNGRQGLNWKRSTH